MKYTTSASILIGGVECIRTAEIHYNTVGSVVGIDRITFIDEAGDEVETNDLFTHEELEQIADDSNLANPDDETFDDKG